MSYKHVASNALHCLRIGLTGLALIQFTIGGPLASSVQAATDNDANTTSPIKHVIVIIGENRSFDHVFATYVPAKGQTIRNLLSSESSTPTAPQGPTLVGPSSMPRPIQVAMPFSSTLPSPPSQAISCPPHS